MENLGAGLAAFQPKRVAQNVDIVLILRVSAQADALADALRSTSVLNKPDQALIRRRSATGRSPIGGQGRVPKHDEQRALKRGGGYFVHHP